MAIGTSSAVGVRSGGIAQVICGTALGCPFTLNTDARTAQTSAMLYNPSSITDSTFRWVRVQPGTTRMLIRAKVAKATTAVGTSPIVNVIGAYSVSDAETDCAGVADGTIQFLRLDSATWAGTGLTLSFPASPSTTNCYNDTTYFYSDVASITPIDLQGCEWVGAAVATLGATTATTAIIVEGIFLN